MINIYKIIFRLIERPKKITELMVYFLYLEQNLSQPPETSI